MEFDLSTEEVQIVTIDKTRMPIRFRMGSQSILVVLFHGAGRRTGNDEPLFQGFLNIAAHQIAISDPEMLRDRELQTSWFLGRNTQLLKPLLCQFLESLGTRIGASRFILVGGSSGGFAALNLACEFGDRALAIAASPQTNLLTYWNQRAVARFRASCFPELSDNLQLAEFVDLDLGRLYCSGFSNSVVLIQSAGDREHLAGQFTGLLQGLEQSDFDRVVLDVGYWGVQGHSASVPVLAYLRWVQVALAAADWRADTLLDLRHILDRRASPSKAEAVPTSRLESTGTEAFNAGDIRRAELLRDYVLGSTKGS